MSDLIVPIVIIIVMFLLIDSIENWILLLLFGLMFIPLSFMFTYQMADSTYTVLFGADISAYTGNLTGFDTIMQMVMWFIPIVAFAKLYIMRKSDTMDEQEASDGIV